MMWESLILTCDTREPEVAIHPWARFFPENIKLERGPLTTGDFCLKGMEDFSVIERKTPSDLIGCMTRGRERFERELARSRHLRAFAVVISGGLIECIAQCRGLRESAFIGSVAAWSRRYGVSFNFCDSERLAAEFSWRYLASQFTEAQFVINNVKKQSLNSNDSTT
jgi:DNA excision repair protein ERCC-4